MIFATMALAFIVGLVLFVLAVFEAPEGYEDETGFHPLWQNNRPDAKDVVCIWRVSEGSMATF